MSTYGSASAPGQNTINYDAILSTSLFNYQRTLVDNISKSNAYFYKIQENGLYEEEVVLQSKFLSCMLLVQRIGIPLMIP